MNRRHFAMGLALSSSFIANGAHAQASKPTTNLPNSDVEAKYQLDTLQAGTKSLETSKLALGSAQDASVKEFAQFEVAEQETIAEILKNKMTDPVEGKDKYPAQRAENRSGNAAAPSVSPTTDTADALKELKSLKGSQFDQAYVKAQIEGHRKLLAIQESYIAAGQNPASIAVAKLARGMIKEHLTLLGHMKSA